MEITYIGPWILLSLGTLLMLAAVYIAVVQQGRPVSLLTFGFLSIGVGIHGPLFMGQYAKFFRVMVSLVSTADADPETYKVVFDRIGQGDFDPELQKIAVGYALSRPIEDMDRLLDEAIGGATNDQGRAALQQLAEESAARVREQKVFAALRHSPRSAQLIASLEQGRTLQEATTRIEQGTTSLAKIEIEGP